MFGDMTDTIIIAWIRLPGRPSMPWREVSIMDQRREFVRLATREGTNRRELCRRFGIHPDTGYKWLGRWAANEELADRSRRPHTSPKRTNAEIETRILAVRDAHPAWGARTIAHVLKKDGLQPPAVSTVHEILRRHDRIGAPSLGGPPAKLRFEMPAPNLLWQMDFKGWVPLANETRCHPLTILDDHSRYNLCLEACANERGSTVRERMELTFRRYGLPEAFFVDNGTPWGDPSGECWTRLGVWLLKLGVEVWHSRPYHPQSRGKNERFHRTLKAEVFAVAHFRDLAEVQRAFDAWRSVYNLDRPHAALNYDVPASRYRPSVRSMPDRLPSVEYDDADIVRTVGATKTYVSFKGRLWKVPQAFGGERVAIRPLTGDGQYGIFLGAHQIANIDLTNNESVGHVPEQVSVISPG
jgi:transposase InsO family protein